MKKLELKKRTVARLQDEELKSVNGAGGKYSKKDKIIKEPQSCCKKSCNGKGEK